MKQISLIFILLFSLLTPTSQAEIPFNQALGVYEGTRDEFKHISPFWGMVAIHGMLEQIRFFGNYHKVKGDQERDVDKPDDPIAQLIKELFPSPDGVQFVANTRDKDPVGGLSRDLAKINKLIEILLQNASQAKKIALVKDLLKNEGNESDVSEFAKILVTAYQRQNHIANPQKPGQQLYPENIVIISLLGFFAKVADSKQDFAKLPLLMKDNFDPTGVFTKQDYETKLNDLETTMSRAQNSPELLFLMAKGFDAYENPFMKPIQYRGDTCLKTSQGFPDCGETSLRNIFMMLLGKNGIITSEALTNLQNKIDPLDGINLNDPNTSFQKLITFFKEHPLLSDAATRKSHNAWAGIVSNLNRTEKIETLEDVQYGRGEEDQTPIYEIKSDFSNIGVKGMINMLNVIAKIIPDKQLNEPWSRDETTRLQQASQKFTRFCELLSRENHEISWENKGSQDQTLSGPFGTLTFLINYNPAYDWRFIVGHFQIDSYASDVTDWRLTYDGLSFPNEWLAFFYRTLNEIKSLEDDKYGDTQPLTFIYNSQLRSLDSAFKTISFVLYKAIMQDRLKQFLPLIARWIDISIPIDDEYATDMLTLILYSPAIQGVKAVTNLLRDNAKFESINKKISYWQHQDQDNIIRQMTKTNLSISALVLMAHSLGLEQKITLTLSNNSKITDSILQKINNLTKITSLDLVSNYTITNAGLNNLTNLISLNLFGNNTITDVGIRNLTNLKSLNLQVNKTITDAGLQNLTNLTALSLAYNHTITDASLQKLTNLTSLILEQNYTITDVGLQNLINLTTLILEDNDIITDVGIQNLTNLTSLNLFGNNVITDAGLQNLTNLTSLNLTFNQSITNAGLQNLTNLTSLSLKENSIITDAGLQNLTNLTSLDLQGNKQITDAGLLQHLTNLTSLNLTNNNVITDAGLQNLSNLKSLNLTHNNTITDEFIKNHPHIQIIGRDR